MRVRIFAGVVVLAAALGMAGCSSGGSDTASISDDGSRSAESEQSGQPKPGSTELPDAVDPDSLPAVESASGGLVLAHGEPDSGCTMLVLGDQGVKKLGTFDQVEGDSKAQDCTVLRHYTADFKSKVDVAGNSQDSKVVLQEIDGDEEAITKSGYFNNPVIGPDKKIYVVHGAKPSEAKTSVMNMDGSGLKELSNTRLRPDWVGGRLVDARGAYNTVSNSDGTLAVEYVSTLGSGGSGYRVGEVSEPKGYGSTVDGDVVVDEQALRPLAWVGENQFITVRNGLTVELNTVKVGDSKPTITTKELVTLPEMYQTQVARMVVSGNKAYFTVSLGGTQTLPDRQHAILTLDVKKGELTTLASVLDNSDVGGAPVEVMAFVE